MVLEGVARYEERRALFFTGAHQSGGEEGIQNRIMRTAKNQLDQANQIERYASISKSTGFLN